MLFFLQCDLWSAFYVLYNKGAEGIFTSNKKAGEWKGEKHRYFYILRYLAKFRIKNNTFCAMTWI